MTRPGRVHAVITNDDGIGSEGLRMLACAAIRAGWDVVIAAPDRQASGSGAALTAACRPGTSCLPKPELA
jgi:5'-nucleotidase